MTRIPLTGADGLFAEVDPLDFGWLSQWSWRAEQGRSDAYYAVRTRNHGGDRSRTVKVRMARLIMGAEPDEEVDHLNGDTLDNRRCNLRLCSASGNSHNRASRQNASGYRGVQRRSDTCWRATIEQSGRKINVGHFNTAIEAALAYDAKARDLYGDQARTNFAEASDV